MAAIRLAAALVAVSVIAAHSAPQQPPPAPTGTGVIVGQVVDAESRAPIAGVAVGLAGPAVPRTAEQSVITDPQGRFAFRLLPKGTYVISASMGGNGFSPNGFVVTGMGFPIAPYLNGGLGQVRPNGPLQPVDLADGGRIEDAVIRLWKPGAVGGQVVDESGEPLVGQVVGVVQLSSDGRLLTGPTVRSDDRGVFRVGTLVPGTYLVFVPLTQVSMPTSVGDDQAFGAPDPIASQRFAAAGAPSPTLSGVAVGSTLVATSPSFANFGGGGGLITSALAPVSIGGAIYAYPTTFFPSATSASGAGRIVIRSGEERSNLVVTVRPLPAVRVAGVLTDDAGPVPGMGVHLLPGDIRDDASILETAVTSTDARGAFAFPTVAAGSYTIVVSRPSPVPSGNPQQPSAEPARISDQPGAWAVQPLVVGDRAVENVGVRVRQPVTITGEVHFSGTSLPPAADRIRNSTVTVGRARSLFRAPGGRPGSVIDLSANGRISIKGVAPPGRFFVGAATLPPPWTLESVTLDGRDITDTGFLIEDRDLSGLVLTYTDKPAGISGTVISSQTGADDTSVFLMPADRARWPDARLSTRTFQAARPNRARMFSWTNVPPGDYLVVATRDTSAGDWPDEAFIAKLAALATPVRLAAGQQVNLSLEVKVVR
jgi:hypothetical protein